MIRFTQQELDAHRLRLAKLKAAGTVRTHRCGNPDELAGKENLQSRLEGAKQGRYGANGGKAVPKLVLGPKIAPQPPNKPRTHVFVGLEAAICEFRFAAPRKWRFDYAWPDKMVALEQEGGVWIQGRHTRGKGYIADLEKYAEAACRGWLVIRATPQQIESGQAWRWVRRALDLKR